MCWGPDVSESYAKFTVNRAGNIRFGMAAVKGVGEGAGAGHHQSTPGRRISRYL